GRNGIEAEVVKKHSEMNGGESVVDLIDRGEVGMIVNTPSGGTTRADGYRIRAAAIAAGMPIFTTVSELDAAVAAISRLSEGVTVKPLQEYEADRLARKTK
ncbi:MAG: hypothetical protein ACTJF6_10945, partial [Microbacteriaceae bacterium]